MGKKLGFYVELVSNRTQIKRAVAVKREWESATAMAKGRVASLTAECATIRTTFQEHRDHLRAKEMECKVLRLNLAKESNLCATLEKDCISLRAVNENVQKITAELCEIVGMQGGLHRRSASRGSIHRGFDEARSVACCGIS